MLEFKKFKVEDLVEHPNNSTRFKTMDPEEWTLFVEDIRINGIRSPITVNKLNNRVIKGNHRLRAMREVGIEETTAILIDIPEDKEDEELIADNVLRREVTVFEKMTYVTWIREVNGWRTGKGGHNQVAVKDDSGKSPRDIIAGRINESTRFVTMADVFSSLNPERQQEVIDWFYKIEKDEGKVSNKELHVRILEAKEKGKGATLSPSDVEAVDTCMQVKAMTSDIKEQQAQLKKQEVQASRMQGKLNDSQLITDLLYEIKKLTNAYITPLDEKKITDEVRQKFQKEISSILSMLYTWRIKLEAKFQINTNKEDIQ